MKNKNIQRVECRCGVFQKPIWTGKCWSNIENGIDNLSNWQNWQFCLQVPEECRVTATEWERIVVDLMGKRVVTAEATPSINTGCCGESCGWKDAALVFKKLYHSSMVLMIKESPMEEVTKEMEKFLIV